MIYDGINSEVTNLNWDFLLLKSPPFLIYTIILSDTIFPVAIYANLIYFGMKALLRMRQVHFLKGVGSWKIAKS